jgi:hypothetical protein
MLQKLWMIALMPLAIHLLLGSVLLVIDAVHGVNDQDFSFAVALLFYYFNWLPWQVINGMGAEFSIMRLMVTGVPFWIGLGVLVVCFGRLLVHRKSENPPN